MAQPKKSQTDLVEILPGSVTGYRTVSHKSNSDKTNQVITFKINKIDNGDLHDNS